MGIIIIFPKVGQIWVHLGSQDPGKTERALLFQALFKYLGFKRILKYLLQFFPQNL